MSSEEKQRVMEMWNEHLERHNIRLKFLSSNAAQEEKFNADFKENVVRSKKLTHEEKMEILRYAEL
jgi:hypothetical protein